MKKAALFLGILLLLAGSAWAKKVTNPIREIIVEGTKNVKTKVVYKAIKSKKGKAYSEEKVREDVQRILEQGYFDNVEVAFDPAAMRITFIVKEKPQIKKVNFKGNKVFSQGKLRSTSEMKEKEYYDVAKLEESRSKIITLYHDKGYADLKLEIYPTLNELENKITITYILSEGNRILIGKVKVKGVNAYKPKKILKLMKTRRKKVYKDETIREDLREVAKFYKNNGYVDVQVGEPSITYNEERTKMFIEIPITEGPKYRVGRISFSGNKEYGEKQLAKAMLIKTGMIYKEEKLNESRQAVLEMYSDKGYLNCRVEPVFTPDVQKEKMNINFDITENNIVYVGQIYIDGLNFTKEFVIRREVTLKEGDIFAAGRVRRSMEKIYNLGFIDAVEPEILPTERKDVMDLSFNITEGKPGVLTAGAGYSSIDKLVGSLQVQHINLFGRAQRLNVLWEFGARRQNYEIDWTEPWFLNKPMSLGLGLFNMERRRDYGTVYNAYKEGRKGGSVRVGPRLSDNLSLLFAYSYEDIEVFEIDPDLVSTISASKDITSSLSSSVVWDTRDNIFDPSTGNRQALTVQYAGGVLGGDVNFVKPTARSSWFFPTFWKFVLSCNVTMGAVESFPPSTEVPIYEKFYVGGADSIRGYQYRSEIGPVEGGKFMAIGNVEYKFPIVQEKKRTILQGAFFYDIGGAWRTANDFELSLGEEETKLKAGFGFGIRFTTPVFPLRLDWGYGLNHKPGEELSQFYFTIGNIF
ncbi:MAG: outer membrane protein assembly factor BamA [Endomicrobiales bacterium]|nr:outer membrane protein assembly factor BamA [Endomicrobiales bacterium]